MMAKAPSVPGASVRRPAASGVKAKRPSACSANTPTLASSRKSRCTEFGMRTGGLGQCGR